MNFHCLVSSSRSRKPIPMQVVADDSAEAAHACWCARGFTGMPYVHCHGSKCVVTDGHSVVKVQILSQESDEPTCCQHHLRNPNSPRGCR